MELRNIVKSDWYDVFFVETLYYRGQYFFQPCFRFLQIYLVLIRKIQQNYLNPVCL